MQKTALITGGSGGIGSAVAEALAADGWSVAVCYSKSQAEAENVVNGIIRSGGKAVSVRCNVTAPGEIADAFRRAEKALGTVFLLVNCAGISVNGQIQDMTDGDIESLMKVNLFGTVYACREAAKHFVPKHEGCIINIASVWGVCGASCESVYSATKFGIVGFSEALSRELGPSGIRVNCVSPGVIDTKMNACYDASAMKELADEASLGRIGRPEEVADAVAFLASERALFITGQNLVVDGGFI